MGQSHSSWQPEADKVRPQPEAEKVRPPQKAEKSWLQPPAGMVSRRRFLPETLALLNLFCNSDELTTMVTLTSSSFFHPRQAGAAAAKGSAGRTHELEEEEEAGLSRVSKQ